VRDGVAGGAVVPDESREVLEQRRGPARKQRSRLWITGAFSSEVRYCTTTIRTWTMETCAATRNILERIFHGLANGVDSCRCRPGGQGMFGPQLEAEDQFAEHLSLIGVGCKRAFKGGFAFRSVQFDAQVADLGQPSFGAVQEELDLSALDVDLEQIDLRETTARHQCRYIPAIHEGVAGSSPGTASRTRAVALVLPPNQGERLSVSTRLPPSPRWHDRHKDQGLLPERDSCRDWLQW